MNISEAIKYLKNGEKIKRHNWASRFLYYVPAANYPAMTDIAKTIMDNNGKVAYTEYIAEYNHPYVSFYQPTQEDIFATDWEFLILLMNLV